MRPWIGAKTGLNFPRQAEVEQVVGMEMGERDDRVQPVAEFRRELAVDGFVVVADAGKDGCAIPLTIRLCG